MEDDFYGKRHHQVLKVLRIATPNLNIFQTNLGDPTWRCRLF
jgi:hypothetical protein